MPIEIVLRPKVEVQEVITAWVCNVCGKKRTIEEHGKYDANSDMHEIQLSGGYSDDYPCDLQTLKFITCGHCLRKWTDTFAIEPDSNHLMGYSFENSPYEVGHTETGEIWEITNGFARPKGCDIPWPTQNEVGFYENADGSAWEVPDIYEPAPGSVHMHFKGRFYRVTSVVNDIRAPHEPLVFYMGLYGENDDHLRPHKMWVEWVNRPDWTGPRFIPAGE